MSTLKENALYLRKNMTPQEQKLWNYLRKRQLNGYKFLRQYIIGNYIVDFVCRDKKLIIEIDGGQHNDSNTKELDNIRTKYLNNKEYRVLRFWNCDIDNNIQAVYDAILEYL